jgi:hypothetical protein
MTQFTFEDNLIAGLSTTELPIEGQVVFLHGVDDAILNTNTVSGAQGLFKAFQHAGTVTWANNVLDSAYKVFHDETDGGTSGLAPVQWTV